jgi:hypothetical protein
VQLSVNLSTFMAYVERACVRACARAKRLTCFDKTVGKTYGTTTSSNDNITAIVNGEPASRTCSDR